VELSAVRQFGFLAHTRLELYVPALQRGTAEQVLYGSSYSASLAIRSDALFEATLKVLRGKSAGWTYKSVKLKKDYRAEMKTSSAQMSPRQIKLSLLRIESTGDVLSVGASKS